MKNLRKPSLLLSIFHLLRKTEDSNPTQFITETLFSRQVAHPIALLHLPFVVREARLEQVLTGFQNPSSTIEILPFICGFRIPSTRENLQPIG